MYCGAAGQEVGGAASQALASDETIIFVEPARSVGL